MIPQCLTIPFVFRLNRQGAVSIGTTLEFINEPVPPMDLTSYGFIVNNSKQTEAVPYLAKLVKCLHEHPNWASLYSFFDKRYTLGMFSEAPKIKATYGSEKYKVPVNVDTASVGLPADFFTTLEDGFSAACHSMLGDPLPASIAPAIGMGIGMHVMDLCYARKDPKGRAFSDWEKMWKTIEQWARQYDAKRATHGGIVYSTRGQPESEQHIWGVKPEYIWTRPVQGAGAFAYAFGQIAASPFKFRNWELDWMQLVVSDLARVCFEERYPSGGSAADFDLYSGPKEKGCPSTMKGDDWVAWSKTIESGQIIVPKTHFEARWAALILANLDCGFIIKRKGVDWELCREPDKVYI